MRDKTLLKQLQMLPLDAKILMTQQRIREWYNYFGGKVCVSFSGGKDSTVLAHLVHQMYPEVPLVFANTGLEYPEIQSFARKMGAEFVRPKMMFNEVISRYGYPIISKEVAEAIHYARKIVAKKPGNVDFVEREREREYRSPTGNGKRCTGRETTLQYCGDKDPPHGRTGWRRANLTNNLPDFHTGGGYKETQRKQQHGIGSTLPDGGRSRGARLPIRTDGPNIPQNGNAWRISGTLCRKPKRSSLQERQRESPCRTTAGSKSRRNREFRRIKRFREQLMGKD